MELQPNLEPKQAAAYIKIGEFPQLEDDRVIQRGITM